MRNQRNNVPFRANASDNELSMRESAGERHDAAYNSFYRNAEGKRIDTGLRLVETLREEYPQLHVTTTTTNTCNLLYYAALGHASATPVDSTVSQSWIWRWFRPPATRLSGSGFLYDVVTFGKYMYRWNGKDYILYNVVCPAGGYQSNMTYLLSPTSNDNDELILAACNYFSSTQKKILVFDSGYWYASSELWQSVQDSRWDDVILDPGMKKSIIGEIEKFYNSRDRYKKLRVPWKRGLIFHGPPGNGKTISLKAMMHSLDSRPDPIPTLYVRSLTSYNGPEYAISQIFGKARQQAPCFLVFEDLDSLITDKVRSYFLNEVDGLENHDGILMVGSTNHLERLDPGISKRPSRFDRKFLFSNPNMDERIQYCEFWRGKLADNENIEFPASMKQAIASITDGFSFAYIQEAFVAALLAIANGDADDSSCEQARSERDIGNFVSNSLDSPTSEQWALESPNEEPRDDKDLEKYVLWREIKKAIQNLRDELDSELRQSLV